MSSELRVAKMYEISGEILKELIESYPLEQFVRGFMALNVLKTNSDYTHVWQAIWEHHKTEGQSYEEWWHDVAAPLVYDRPLFIFTGARFYNSTNQGIVSYYSDVSDDDLRRLRHFTENSRKLTLRVYLEE